MFKSLIKATALAAAMSVPALAASASVATPPLGHQGQWWTNPAGCQYSRAGRPGETMWFLIVNTSQPGCPTYIKGYSMDGVYKAHGPKN